MPLINTLYIEHALLHLLYSRFLQKEINKCNENKLTEPFKTYLLKEWFVMNHIKIKMGTGFIQMNREINSKTAVKNKVK